MEITLRLATPADAEAIARLHVASWRIAYRDLAPPAAFEILTVERRLTLWTEVLNKPQPSAALWLAVAPNTLAGFGYASPEPNPALQGYPEIKTLYVDAAFQRRRIGYRLMRAMAGSLASAGCSRAALSVVRGNDPALAFYEALGGRRIGEYSDPGPVWLSQNFIYAWDELGSLVKPAA